MKRRFSVLLAVLLAVCLLSVQMAQAAELRSDIGRPRLSFNGTTAVCSAVCRADSFTDAVDATLTLYRDNAYVNSWSVSGVWQVSLSGEHTVSSGHTYRLVLTYSVNGVSQPSKSTTKAL